MTARDLIVEPLRPQDDDQLFDIFSDVVERREGYPHEPPLTHDTFMSLWRGPGVVTVCARTPDPDAAVLGAYYLKPNYAGRAAHIANAGYVVARAARGAGVGRMLVEDSIQRAPVLGFDAIMFNLVFVTNPARRLYEELGWREIGRVPGAVGGDDALIYWRPVGGADPSAADPSSAGPSAADPETEPQRP